MNIQRIFERYSREAQKFSQVVINLAVQFDLKPSVARERFESFRKHNPLLDWMECARAAQQTHEGIAWMQEDHECQH